MLNFCCLLFSCDRPAMQRVKARSRNDNFMTFIQLTRTRKDLYGRGIMRKEEASLLLDHARANIQLLV